jgi:hypothetical protein
MGACSHNAGMARVPVRGVCHAILRIDVVPERVQRLREDVARRCREGDARLVELVVDLGLPKTQPHEYPAHRKRNLGPVSNFLYIQRDLRVLA